MISQAAPDTHEYVVEGQLHHYYYYYSMSFFFDGGWFRTFFLPLLFVFGVRVMLQQQQRIVKNSPPDAPSFLHTPDEPVI